MGGIRGAFKAAIISLGKIARSIAAEIGVNILSILTGDVLDVISSLRARENLASSSSTFSKLLSRLLQLSSQAALQNMEVVMWSGWWILGIE
jgi:hypothetical protein